MIESASTKGRSCTFLHYLVTYDLKNELGIKLRDKEALSEKQHESSRPTVILMGPLSQ